MKTSFKLSALAILLTAGLFTASPVKAADLPADQITVRGTGKAMVVGLVLKKESAGRAIVKFYDAQNNEIMRDYVSEKQSSAKGYNLSDLELGKYTITVSAAGEVVTKNVLVYEDEGKKTYIILQ